MDIVKKNILSIICGVVALLAVAALFWPLGGYHSELKSTLDSRLGVYRSVESLRTKSRHLPVVSPESSEPVILTRFPNDEVIKQGETVRNQFQTESKKIQEAAASINLHKQLVDGALPNPRTATTAFQFRDRSRIVIEKTIPLEILKVGLPPTPEQIKAAQDELWTKKFVPQLAIAGQAAQAQIQELFNAEAAKLPEQLTQQVAMNSMCYMDQAALVRDQNLDKGSAPDPVTMWYSQLTLWIQEDVARAIAATNVGARNVTEAPVKHLLKINISPKPYVLPAGVQPGTAIEGDPAAPVPKAVEVSATGRVCNPLYDVVQFEIVVNVDAERIAWFLRELGDNRFITVRSMNITNVDSVNEQAKGFYYGPKPVAQLTLDCEEVFFRDWSHKLMPEQVAKNMAGESGGAGGPGGGRMGPGMEGMERF